MNSNAPIDVLGRESTTATEIRLFSAAEIVRCHVRSGVSQLFGDYLEGRLVRVAIHGSSAAGRHPDCVSLVRGHECTAERAMVRGRSGQ
jgi:hypothetical protein